MPGCTRNVDHPGLPLDDDHRGVGGGADASDVPAAMKSLLLDDAPFDLRLPAVCAVTRRRCTVSILASVRDERVAEILHPVGLVAHHDDDLRERDQRLDARVPRLILDLLHRSVALVVRVGLVDHSRPPRHRVRVGRRHQHLRQQRIRIERDRRGHLVELLLRERLVAGLGGGKRRTASASARTGQRSQRRKRMVTGAPEGVRRARTRCNGRRSGCGSDSSRPLPTCPRGLT